MNNLLIIVGSACGALFFIEVMQAPHWIKKRLWNRDAYKHRLKPLDCSPCLSFWFCVIPGVFLGKNCPELLYMGVISSVLAVFISKKLNE